MAPPLKDRIDRQLVTSLADRLRAEHPPFDSESFLNAVLPQLEALELKERINIIADAIADHLPDDYPTALAVVRAVAENKLADWEAWPLCSLVERHGLQHPEASLAAMPTLTKQWSCEFAIRPYLDHHLDLTRQYLRQWTDDPDEAVRRLPSEGTRPLLPWGPKVAALIDDPSIGLELLNMLRHDPSETVRRSVANHLNDVAKADPDLVVDTLRGWVGEARPVEAKMVKHALRTLVKNGHRGTLELLGFTTDPQVTVDGFACSPDKINLDSHIELEAKLTSTSDAEQLVVVDFVIHHIGASGAASPKVFKWTNKVLEPGATVTLTKRRKIANASTRTYHPGSHKVELQVSGQIVADTRFEVVIP